MSAASENAVPGDPLYGMKRSAERAQLALAGRPTEQGQLFLDFAQHATRRGGTGGRRRGFAAVTLTTWTPDPARRQSCCSPTLPAPRDQAAALDVIGQFDREQRAQLTAWLDGQRQVERTDRYGLLDQVKRGPTACAPA